VAVSDGRPIELERHLRRLARSARELYGLELDRDGTLRARIDETLRGGDAGLSRLRISLSDDDVRAEVLRVDRDAAFPDAPVELVPLALAGGLGPHKWTDRRIVEDGRAGEALITDLDGSVLETGRGNVFAVEHGRLVTPPADGRILPGVTRAALLELARDAGIEAEEEEISHARLARADEVFVTSSIRGVQPARPGPVTRRLAALLAHEWSQTDASGRTYGPPGGARSDHSRAGLSVSSP
jgi:para-aminobenzoate synthetase/4-amino-4-deoxychorismate lyase